MSDLCLGPVACEKKYCIETGRCLRGFLHQHYCNLQRAQKEEAAQTQRLMQQAKKQKKKNPHVNQYFLIKKCTFTAHKCKLPKVCGILGQCMHSHPLVTDNEDVVKRLFLCKNAHQATEIFEELMPSLQKIGIRFYYRPEQMFIDEQQEILARTAEGGSAAADR